MTRPCPLRRPMNLFPQDIQVSRPCKIIKLRIKARDHQPDRQVQLGTHQLQPCTRPRAPSPGGAHQISVQPRPGGYPSCTTAIMRSSKARLDGRLVSPFAPLMIVSISFLSAPVTFGGGALRRWHMITPKVLAVDSACATRRIKVPSAQRAPCRVRHGRIEEAGGAVGAFCTVLFVASPVWLWVDGVNEAVVTGVNFAKAAADDGPEWSCGSLSWNTYRPQGRRRSRLHAFRWQTAALDRVMWPEKESRRNM